DQFHGPHHPGHLLLLISRAVFIGIVLCLPIFAVASTSSASAAPSSPIRAAALSLPAGLLNSDYFGPKIDGIPWYQPQTGCDSTPKPGVVDFQQLILKTFPQTGDFGISTSCDGTVSEHHEGRAWDWKVSAYNPSDVHTVNIVLKW